MNDKKYWEDYYLKYRTPSVPSAFARHCLKKYLQFGQTLLELGCGNGRDAVFFATQGLWVTAVDQCAEELAFLQSCELMENLKFECSDFTRLPEETIPFDAVYSRFTLHAIDRAGEARVLRWCGSHIKPGGFFLVEARGVKNEIFGLGTPVPDDPDAFIYNGHYRRFLRAEEVIGSLQKLGFETFGEERRGFAPFYGKDEIFLRIIARKRTV